MCQRCSVSFYTLGCRLNQAETAILCETFHAQGYEIRAFGGKTDICVINTCSVTGSSEAKCRHTISKILRQHPETFMIVVGCYPQVGLDALRAIPGIDMLVGTEQKFEVTRYLNDLVAQSNGTPLSKRSEPVIIRSDDLSRDDFTIDSPGHFLTRTRANLKIQDGCNFFCSYCIVPYARGRKRSREFEDIRKEALQLAARGHQEVVVTGVNIGTYSYQGQGLLDVLKMLEEIDGFQRIRLTSIEPMTIPDGIIEYMATSKKLCHFFHIPVQSGDNTILKQMNRHYTREDFAKFLQRLTDLVPDVGIGTDLIVGFPGEGDAEFEHSRQLLAELPLMYAHVFSFSPRRGTPAATFPHQVHSQTITQRSEILRKLSAEKRRTFYTKYLGQAVSVLFEQRESNGLFTGYTGNYIKVGILTEEHLSNCFRNVILSDIDGKIAIGRLGNT
jgi:threonylcarbamoyladenosine tRNA methylthiotransferase MtaB